MLTRLIIYFGSKNLPDFIRLLAKLEYGVSACLSNLAIAAQADNYPNLNKQLLGHAAEERNHGRMLATLADGKRRINLKGNGRWLSLRIGGEEKSNHPEEGDGKLIIFETGNGIFDNLDGISQRYLALKVFLKGKKMSELPWSDRLACMAVLEEGTLGFYNELSSCEGIPNYIRVVAMKISGEEAGHANYLKYMLPQFTPTPSLEMQKWRDRLFWAKLALIWDFWQFMQSN